MQSNQNIRTIKRVAGAVGLSMALLSSVGAVSACGPGDEPGREPAAHEVSAQSLEALAGSDELSASPSALRSLRNRLRALEDVEALREAAACYGRGHDAIFFDLGGPKAEAFSILESCFESDVRTTVYFFGGPQPVAELNGLSALVGFIENFAISSRYTRARNTPGNIDITLNDDGTATLLSSGATPHFIAATAGGVEPTVDVFTARYVDRLRKGRDGRWRSFAKELHIDTVWRGNGQYPLGGPGALR